MKPTDLRGILQYIPRFRDKVFVLAIDGAVVTDENFANLLLDVAVLRSVRLAIRRMSFFDDLRLAINKFPEKKRSKLG